MLPTETIKSFKDLKANLKKDLSKLKKIKIALLGDSTTSLLRIALQGYGYEEGFNLELFEADYNQIEQQVFDTDSELYKFKPEIVIIFQTSQKLRLKFYQSSKSGQKSFATNQIKFTAQLNSLISKRLGAKIIYFNFIELNDSVFGNYANKSVSSLPYQLRKLNYQLMLLTKKSKSLFIFDLNSLVNQFGTKTAINSKLYITADLALDLDFFPAVAKNLLDIILAFEGKIIKCIILDLDNVLWGGVIGDDGLENIQIGELGIGKAFSQLQLWLKQLQMRGVMLAVCSKNNPQIAKEVFLKHPAMVLKLNDFAIFVANWESKIDNIAGIQKQLNIGFDSMVFLDDSPLEREMIKGSFQQMKVPDLPEDPSEYLSYLESLNLFETTSYSKEDTQRTRLYHQESKRNYIFEKVGDEKIFLQKLKMRAEIKAFGPFEVPRVAQLTQRSNQFNLRTIRYSDDQIERISKNKDYLTLSVSLRDKLGDYGLICALIVKKEKDHLFIDTWIMSCRVLRRGVERLVLNYLVKLAQEKKIQEIWGQFIPTAKNELVKDHYQNLGFSRDKDLWKLKVENFQPHSCYIEFSNLE